MSKEAMKLALEHAKRDERHASHAETRYWCHMYRDIAEKAVEALAEQPAPVAKPRKQEPVAYAVYHRMGGSKSLHWSEQHSPDGDSNEYQLLPLYTSPQAQPAQRKPLTDEQWQSIADTLGCIITRSQKDAIEATIGIKGDA